MPVCGVIPWHLRHDRFYGYDGFLYSIGFIAGYIVALFVIAEPLKRLGKFTFTDALNNRFNSRRITLTAAISTLVVSVFYIIPQMVGAGALIKALLGWSHVQGVLAVGTVVTVIVVTAGMVSTTWLQFIKGSLLVVFCAILAVFILNRGLQVDTRFSHGLPVPESATEAWAGKPYVRDAQGRLWRKDADNTVSQVQWMVADAKGVVQTLNGVAKSAEGKLIPVGGISKLPTGATSTGPLSPGDYLNTLQDSEVLLWSKEVITDADGTTTTV